MTGYSLEELRRKTFFDITHPADLASERQVFAEQWSGPRSAYTVEKRYIRKDGGVIWVELAASIVHSDDSTPAYGVRIVRDITDRKRAEEQQRLLLHELNHRVKNTLSVAEAAHQTFKSGMVPPELLRSFEGRSTGRSPQPLDEADVGSDADSGSRRGGAAAVPDCQPPHFARRPEPSPDPVRNHHAHACPPRACDERGKVRRIVERRRYSRSAMDD